MVDFAVVARNVSYRYPDGSLGVENVDLAIAKGERVAIVGENGSGKSTLIFLLSGLLKPSKGEVKVLGFSNKEIEEIRRRVGVIFQNPDDFLFNPTVRDELLYVPRQLKMSEEEMERIIRDFSEIFGLKDVLHKPPFRLSGGEKKKVEIASVLAYKPEIIFLDEPTANVDAKTRKVIKEIIRGYEGTVVVATHEVDVAKLCERVLVMKKGRILADSSFSSIDKRILEEAGVI
uniref:ABC transporter ATP-binding protein n=1 Tax=Archaeoglobus fulgidus TaxID=2234 RepID=A0A7J3M498_ARCFL